MPMVEFSSEELSLAADTVPSTSEHEFMIEAIENHRHKQAAEVQAEAWDRIHKSRAFLAKQLTMGHTKKKEEEIKRTINRNIDDMFAHKEIELGYVMMNRDETLRNFSDWEQ